MADKNRSHGKIDNLPVAIKKEVENRLLEGHTYEDIAEYLKGMGHEVHFSSVGRYGRGYLKKFESVRMAKEYAQLLAEDNVDRPTTELHEANNALISQLLMEMLINEELSAAEKAKIAKAISDLQSAQVRNEKLKIDARKASGEVHTAMNVLKAKVFEKIGSEHPDIAEAIMSIADEVENENEITV